MRQGLEGDVIFSTAIFGKKQITFWTLDLSLIWARNRNL